jgi:hypothetical protein
MLPLYAERCDEVTVEATEGVSGEPNSETGIEAPTAVPFELPTWMAAAMDMPAIAACSADVEQLV